jgi:hypothetical protein
MVVIVEAVSTGQMSPDEAAELSRLVESFVKVTEIGEELWAEVGDGLTG